MTPGWDPQSLQGRLVCHSRALDRPRDGQAPTVPSARWVPRRPLPVLAQPWPGSGLLPGPAAQAPRHPGSDLVPLVQEGRSTPSPQPARSWCSQLQCQGRDGSLVPRGSAQPRPHGSPQPQPRPRMQAAPHLPVPGHLPTPTSGSSSGRPQGQGGVLSTQSPQVGG